MHRCRGVSAEYERVEHSGKIELFKVAPENCEEGGWRENRTDKLKEPSGKQRPRCKVL